MQLATALNRARCSSRLACMIDFVRRPPRDDTSCMQRSAAYRTVRTLLVCLAFYRRAIELRLQLGPLRRRPSDGLGDRHSKSVSFTSSEYSAAALCQLLYPDRRRRARTTAPLEHDIPLYLILRVRPPHFLPACIHYTTLRLFASTAPHLRFVRPPAPARFAFVDPSLYLCVGRPTPSFMPSPCHRRILARDRVDHCIDIIVPFSEVIRTCRLSAPSCAS